MSPAKKGNKPQRFSENHSSRHFFDSTTMSFGYYTDNFIASYKFDTMDEWYEFERSFMNIKYAATRLSDHDINARYVTSWLELVDDHARRYPGEQLNRPMIPRDIRLTQGEIWELRNMTVPDNWTGYWNEYEEMDLSPYIGGSSSSSSESKDE